jgi:hypothetical protein
MIRKLLYLTVLLLPGIAHSADPSADLSVNVVPPGSTPPAPAGAAAAGFTTLALNSDFTQKMPAGWLGGCATPGNGQPVSPQYHDDGGPHIWWMNIWWSATYQNCNTVQLQDPDLGGLTLDMPWTVAASAYSVGTVIQSGSWDYDPKVPQGQVHDFPNNAYYEIVLRLTPVIPASWGGMFSWPSKAMADGTQGGLEYDTIELDSGNLAGSDSAWHNWHAGDVHVNGGWVWGPGTGNNGLPTNFDPRQYHKFGLRTTSGRTAWACRFLDDVFRKCVQVTNFDSTWNTTQRYFLGVQNACDGWNYNGTCNGNDGITQHVYVKSVRVWSCTDWKTTQCNGKVLTGAP